MGSTGVLHFTTNSPTFGATGNSTLSRCRYHVPDEHLWHGSWQIASQKHCLVKEIRDTLDPPHRRKQSAFSWFFNWFAYLWCRWWFLLLWILFFDRIVAINPYVVPCNNAWQKGGIIFRMLLRFTACYCRLFHSVTKAEMWLHCRAPRLWWSQPAMPFSGMWQQKMLPNIQYDCHFDTISSS